MESEQRARVHAALGDPERLRIVDDLTLTDRSVNELGDLVHMPGNLLAHHLEVLENAGLIRRHMSEGDHRRRYVSLQRDMMAMLIARDSRPVQSVLFVCTHNSARSQFAAALWRRRSGGPARSAGTQPARTVHPLAIKVAAEFGIDLSRAKPKGYDSIGPAPALVVSVCDRAREAGLPPAGSHLHWSVPDPLAKSTLSAFRAAFTEITERVEVLATTSPRPLSRRSVST
ncbi:MAG: helix-turn-helix domain-containing protein [Acidimicrobiia bacterium]